jgi:hypothetical protein
MTCPFCAERHEFDRRSLHAHMVAAHIAAVDVGLEDAKQRLYYRLNCPRCEYAVSQTVRPRSTDARFLEEYRAEIGLVAFDLLLYHLELAHATPTPEALLSE